MDFNVLLMAKVGREHPKEVEPARKRGDQKDERKVTLSDSFGKCLGQVGPQHNA